MFAVCSLEAISCLAAPIVRSMMSATAIGAEHGALQSIIVTIETAGLLLGPVFFNGVYDVSENRDHQWQTGLVLFGTMASPMVACLLAILALRPHDEISSALTLEPVEPLVVGNDANRDQEPDQESKHQNFEKVTSMTGSECHQNLNTGLTTESPFTHLVKHNKQDHV